MFCYKNLWVEINFQCQCNFCQPVITNSSSQPCYINKKFGKKKQQTGWEMHSISNFLILFFKHAKWQYFFLIYILLYVYKGAIVGIFICLTYCNMEAPLFHLALFPSTLGRGFESSIPALGFLSLDLIIFSNLSLVFIFSPSKRLLL